MLQLGNILFDSILWFCASGKSFFLGIFLLVIIVSMPTGDKKKWKLYILHLLRICALLLILLSSTPMHPLLYVAGFILLVASCIKGKRQVLFKVLFVLFTLLITILEIPFHISPKIITDDIDSIYVIGDSVSAGMGSKSEKTWSDLLEEQTDIKTINMARAGATTESAIKQLPQFIDEHSVVILEIGGNDLLGYTPLETFETACNELLIKLSKYKQVVWLELPLLPQYYPYGRLQRKLAKENEVTLVPKSILVRVFSAKNATSDGIHLTQEGQRVMALEIQRLFQKKERSP